MIGPVSNTGRAMMASLQQAMAKGMPPDQAIQYVKSMATQGVAPLTDLYAMLNQFQRLKQQQVKPPQTPPTIRDQLNMMDQMQSGIAGKQAPAPQGDSMDRGLGAINAGRMEYPQFVGGGLVAFADGGLTDAEETELAALEKLEENALSPVISPVGGFREFSAVPSVPTYGLYESKKDRLAALRAKRSAAQKTASASSKQAAMAKEAEARGLQYELPRAAPSTTPTTGAGTTTAGGAGAVRTGAGVPTSVDSVDSIFGRERKALETETGKTLEQRLAETEALETRMGIGKAAEERGKYLDRREAEAAKQMSEDRRMALAQAGFAMAEAASRRGRERTGFLGAAAAGGTKGAQLIDKAIRENRDLKDRIAENRFALAQAQEMRKAGNIKDAKALESQATANLRALSMAEAQSKQSLAELGIRESGADRRAAMQAAAEREYRDSLIGLKREELGIKKMAEIAMIPDKEQREKALQEVLKSLAGGEEAMTGVEDLLAKYGK